MAGQGQGRRGEGVSCCRDPGQLPLPDGPTGQVPGLTFQDWWSWKMLREHLVRSPC